MTYSDAYLVGYYGMKNSGDDALFSEGRAATQQCYLQALEE